MDKELQAAVYSVLGDFAGDTTGHDIFHIVRVVDNCQYLHEREGGDWEVIELGALLHDMLDKKLFRQAQRRNWMTGWLNEHVPAHRDELLHIMDVHSWSAYQAGARAETINAEIVFDGDKLDALGAIGIARAFATGASLGRPPVDPTEQRPSTYDHFDEKLFLLPDHLYTETAKAIASERVEYMRHFIDVLDEEAGL